MRKTLMITLLAIVLMFTINLRVFATTPDLSDLIPKSNTTDSAKPEDGATSEESNKNDKDEKTNTTPNELAKTGISGTTIPLIAILGVASLYAYKKVRKYNV